MSSAQYENYAHICLWYDDSLHNKSTDWRWLDESRWWWWVREKLIRRERKSFNFAIATGSCSRLCEYWVAYNCIYARKCVSQITLLSAQTYHKNITLTFVQVKWVSISNSINDASKREREKTVQRAEGKVGKLSPARSSRLTMVTCQSEWDDYDDDEWWKGVERERERQRVQGGWDNFLLSNSLR